MSKKMLTIRLDGYTAEINQESESPIAITYTREDSTDFNEKGSAASYDVTLPATLNNDKALNTFHNPQVEDLTANEYFRVPRACSIVAAGDEIMAGKAILLKAVHNDKPKSYVLNMYGENGDWMVQMQDMTLWDVLPTSTHNFDQSQVEASWLFDGTNRDLCFVYAPVRYSKAFDDNGKDTDQLVTMYHMRPALFAYWLIYNGFQQIGYTVKSTFFDTPQFRRLVLPWVWGNFLKIDSKQLDVLKFRARNTLTYVKDLSPGSSAGIGEYADVTKGYTMDNETTLGAFDNGNVYSWDGVQSKWVYPPQYAAQFGPLIVGFNYVLHLNVSCSWNSNLGVTVEWYKNGVLQSFQAAVSLSAGATSTSQFTGTKTVFWESGSLSSGDEIEVKVKVSGFKTALGSFYCSIGDLQGSGQGTFDHWLENLYFKKPLGGLVDFRQYDKFKNIKYLDFLRGLVDTFDLQPGTDSKTKTVYWEPSHPYIWDDQSGTTYPGYFTADQLDWTAKQDIVKDSTLTLYQDSEREQLLQFKNDNADGGLNIFTGRYNIEPAGSKYLYGSRFKNGQSKLENRFFSPVVHYVVQQWRNITGVAPQLMAIIKENTSNASADEAESEFAPKLAYYKGYVSRTTYGGWLWQPVPGGTIYNNKDLPYMFAVNYKPGGERDPILSYCDEKIPTIANPTPTDYVVGRGLMRRFFLQRLAIRDYGKLYDTFFYLNNRDVMNYLHRERINLHGSQYLLIQINKFMPLLEESTGAQLWKFIPILQKNIDNCFPAQNTVLTQPTTLTNTFDIKYQQLLLLNTDL